MIDEELNYRLTIDFSDDVQYENAAFAIGRLETDHGGLTLPEIWKETEEIRQTLIKTPVEKRAVVMEVTISQTLKDKYKEQSDDPVRTQVCILLLLVLRLIKAAPTDQNADQEKNTNADLIRTIVRIVGYTASHDQQLLEVVNELVDLIDKEGDQNEKRGKVVKFGEDILSNDDDWVDKLRTIVARYKEKADKADIIDCGEGGDAYDRVWEALLLDEWFVNEMRVQTLNQDFNLLLLFNIFGLMYPWAYKTKIRGAQSIAKVVGYNAELEYKNKFYSKDYFSITLIERLKQGIKTDYFLKHIKEIIKTCKGPVKN